MICVNFNVTMVIVIYTLALLIYAIYKCVPKKVIPLKELRSDGMMPKYLIDMDRAYQSFYRYVNFNNVDGYKAICELEDLVNKAKEEIEYARQQEQSNNLTK